MKPPYLDEEDDDEEDMATIVAPSKLLLGGDRSAPSAGAISDDDDEDDDPKTKAFQSPLPAAGSKAIPGGAPAPAAGSLPIAPQAAFPTQPSALAPVMVAPFNTRGAPTLHIDRAPDAPGFGGALLASDDEGAAPTWFLAFLAACAVMTALGLGVLIWLKLQGRW